MIEFTKSEIQTYYHARIPKLINVQGKLRGACPVHGGKDPNFSIDWETGQSYCHSQCSRGFDILSLERELSGVDFIKAKEEVFRLVGRPKPNWQERDVEATYDYTDENGNVAYQVVRRVGKKFSQRRPDGNGGWLNGLGKDHKPLPFRLPALVKSSIVAICYSRDTEILTDSGWVAFPRLTSADRVAEYWAEDGAVDFTFPVALQRIPFNGEMCNFRADWCDMLVTPDHRVLGRSRAWTKRGVKMCAPLVKTAKDIKGMWYYPTSGCARYEHDEGPTEAQARLIAAWCADGVNEKRGLKVSWNLKKKRKVDRLYELLRGCGVEFTVHIYPSCPEWTNVRVVRSTVSFFDKWSPGKMVPLSAMGWSYQARLSLLSELQYWDGDQTGVQGTRYFTAEESEANAVSAIAAITGWGCIVRRDNRQGRPDQATQFVLNLSRKEWRSTQAPVQVPYDGQDVFCCTVPSGFLITRRNGKTTVSGNCEGEKDCLSLIRAGWAATCNNGGAGNFRAELVPYFAGKHVAIFADNDEAGRKHAELVAGLLTATAASVRVVEIPDLPLKGDVSDFLNSGHTGSELREMWRNTEEWTPEWKFTAPVPHENDRYLLTFGQAVERAGGYESFWKSLDIDGLPSPFESLTRKLGGLRKGEVYVLAARTGQGKTSLALQFAMAALAKRTPVLMFSMEMSHRDGFQRLAAIDARVDLAHYRRLRRSGEVDSPVVCQYDDALRHATAKYARMPFYVTTKTGVTTEFLTEESKRIKERCGIGLVIIDHMQLMGTTGKIKSDYEKFTGISRGTKEIAVELDVPLLLVSQVNRSNASDRRNELEISDCRGSGAIEEDAAGIMLLYYDNDDFKAAKLDPTGERLKRGPIKAYLKLGKNRFGPSGTYEALNHWKSLTRFDPCDQVAS